MLIAVRLVGTWARRAEDGKPPTRTWWAAHVSIYRRSLWATCDDLAGIRGAYTKLIAHALGQNPLGSPTDKAGPLVQAIRAWPVHVMGLVAQLQQPAQSASYSVIAWCAHSV